MPGQHYDMPMTSVYAQRRARLAAQLGDGGVAIIPTAPELHRNRDTEYLYRHDSYFYYLTGFSEPNACLVLTSDGKSVLYSYFWGPNKEFALEVSPGEHDLECIELSRAVVALSEARGFAQP